MLPHHTSLGEMWFLKMCRNEASLVGACVAMFSLFPSSPSSLGTRIASAIIEHSIFWRDYTRKAAPWNGNRGARHFFGAKGKIFRESRILQERFQFCEMKVGKTKKSYNSLCSYSEKMASPVLDAISFCNLPNKEALASVINDSKSEQAFLGATPEDKKEVRNIF